MPDKIRIAHSKHQSAAKIQTAKRFVLCCGRFYSRQWAAAALHWRATLMAEPVPEKNPIRVFISYSWDSEEHKQKVLNLAQRLRSEGVDAHIDRFTTFPAV